MSMPDEQPTKPMSSPPKDSALVLMSKEEKVIPIEISKSFGFTDQVDVEPNSELAWLAPPCRFPPQWALAMLSTVELWT